MRCDRHSTFCLNQNTLIDYSITLIAFSNTLILNCFFQNYFEFKNFFLIWSHPISLFRLRLNILSFFSIKGRHPFLKIVPCTWWDKTFAVNWLAKCFVHLGLQWLSVCQLSVFLFFSFFIFLSVVKKSKRLQKQIDF